MARVAIFTFGILIEPPGHEQIQSYVELTKYVKQQAVGAKGYIDRAIVSQDVEGGTVFDHDWGKWGSYTIPRFYDGSHQGIERRIVQTLSLWQTLQHVFDYAYSGQHVAALRQRNNWFALSQGRFPNHTLWWVGDDETPTWEDACCRNEYLYDYGASPFAFTLKAAFDSAGRSVKLHRRS